MKFWKILSGEGTFTAGDIAREIVSLAAQESEFEARIKEAEKEAIRARQAKMGGGKITEKDVQSTSDVLESAKMDLTALREGKKELYEKLKEKVKKQREEAAQFLRLEEEKITKEKEEKRKRFLKLCCDLLLMKYELEGFCAHTLPGDELHINMIDIPERRDFIQEEFVRLRDNRTGLTVYQKEWELNEKKREFSNKDIDSIVDALLLKAQEYVAKSEDEKQKEV